MSRILGAMLGASLGIALLIAAGAASGQLKRIPLGATPETVASSDAPAFRDPETGQIWTPDNVGEDSKPLDPKDRAFDPGGQAVAARRLVEQVAQTKYLGRVPITAGPTVPLVEIDNLSLRVRPGGHWHVAAHLQNNSAATIAPKIGCSFGSGAKFVAATLVSVPPTAGGERIGIFFFGPPSEVFVDFVTCYVLSP